MADHPRSHHLDREPRRGAAEAGTQGRQRAGLHDHAAARRRHHADLPGHHRHRKRRAGAARAQRGAGDRRPDEGRFRPPRVHELRSPLTTIIGFAHLLTDPATGPLMPKQAEYLSYITTSTNSLFALINNILDLATIDAGAMTLEL